MVYQNAELHSKLTFLTLVGQDEEGRLEWMGRSGDFQKAEKLEDELYEEPWNIHYGKNAF